MLLLGMTIILFILGTVATVDYSVKLYRTMVPVTILQIINQYYIQNITNNLVIEGYDSLAISMAEDIGL